MKLFQPINYLFIQQKPSQSFKIGQNETANNINELTIKNKYRMNGAVF